VGKLANGLIVCNKCGRSTEKASFEALRIARADYRCNDCYRTYSRTYVRRRYQEDPGYRAKAKVSAQKSLRRLKQEVIQGYGGRCVGCGIADARILDLDHVNGGGSKARCHLRGAPTRSNGYAYRDARNRGFPADYQLLCRNCNWLKYLETLRP